MRVYSTQQKRILLPGPIEWKTNNPQLSVIFHYFFYFLNAFLNLSNLSVTIYCSLTIIKPHAYI